jgi:cyclopropane fatty-acyl-phospholipid synthase-like methyltransferase
MEWFIDLYDEFRIRRMLENISNVDTEKDIDFIVDVLNLFKGAKVLDFLCGTGRHSIELAKRGYKSVGIDINSSYLNKARENADEIGVSPLFIQGDVREIDIGSSYDGVINMYNSFGYFSDKENKKVLEKVYNSLKRNGSFLIGILNKNWLLKNFKEKDEYIFNGIKIVEEREFDSSLSRNKFTIRRYGKDGIDVKEGSWRVYSASEIMNILKDIGFRFIAGYDNLDKETLKEDSRLMRLIFEK